MEIPLLLNGIRTKLVSVKMQVQSLASLNGLRVQCFCKLNCRSQVWFRFGIAVAVA